MYTLLVIIFILHNAMIQGVRVTGGNVTVVEGDAALLLCLLTESTDRLRQITWQRRTRPYKQNTNFYTILPDDDPDYFNGHDKRFSFVGDFSLRNGSLQLSNVTVSDEGVYTCIFTLFPTGNVKTEITLTVLVPPETSMKENILMVGNEEVVLATCTATYSWPPADVDWHLGELSDLLRIMRDSSENADGTVTVVSTLFGAPTRRLHNHSVQCVIKSPALAKGATLPLTIQIHSPPSEVRITEISQNSFHCVSDGNPQANFTWSSTSVSWPHSVVKVDDAVLQIIKPSSALKCLFECKATNTYGTKTSLLYLHLSAEGTCATGWTLFGLLLFSNFVVAAMWYYRSVKECILPSLTAEGEETTDAGPAEQSLPLRGSAASSASEHSL